MLANHADLPFPDLRIAEIADAPVLARLRVAGLIEQGLLDPVQADAFLPIAQRELRRLFARKLVAGWVAVTGEAVVGCACVVFWARLPYPDSSVHAEIAGVYVDPEHRRQGLATELTRRAIALAKEREVRKIVLHPSKQAERIYRRLGFVDGNQIFLPSTAQHDAD